MKNFAENLQHKFNNNKDILKKLLVIAVPILLSNIISQIQMIVDRAFLGHVNDMYMSALSNVSSPVWATMSFCFALCMGASIIISQSVGAKEFERTGTYSASLIKWANVIPLILFFFWTFFGKTVFKLMGVSEALLPLCMEYVRWYVPIFLILGLESSTMVIMQTSNYTTPLVWFGIVRSILNVILDWILIFGKFGIPAMGIKGAAIATTLSEYIGFAYATIIFVTSKKLFTRPSLKSVIKAPIKPYLRSAQLGLNSALEDFAWNFGNIMLIKILNSINEKAAGIYTIVFSIEILVVVIIGALGQGTMTLSGEAVGKRSRREYKGVCILAYGLSASVSVVILIVCIIIPEKLIEIFTNDQNIITSCGLYLLIMCLNLFSKSANIIIGNGIRGSGNTVWMFFTQIFGTFFVIGCAWVFVNIFHLGITGVFLAVLADEFVRAVVNVAKYISIVKKMPKDTDIKKHKDE